jgi:hypothetical protein
MVVPGPNCKRGEHGMPPNSAETSRLGLGVGS